MMKRTLPKKANAILKDPACPRGINYRDLALVAAKKYPQLMPNIQSWVEGYGWDEFWVSEGFVDRTGKETRLNVGNLEKKVKLNLPGNRRYEKFKEALPPEAKSIIELGSGVSTMMLKWGAEAPDHVAVGADYQPEVIEAGQMAVRYFGERIKGSVRFEKGNFFNLPREAPFADNTYDACCNFGVLEHFSSDKMQKILREMIRLTRLGGTVLAAVPNFWSPSIMLRRWFIHGVQRTHQPDSPVNLWWPFGYEQPMKKSALLGLFKGFEVNGQVRDTRATGINPFHDFLPDEVWKYKKLYGRESWYKPDKEFPKRWTGMKSTIADIVNSKSPKDEELLKGEYRWFTPWYTPLVNRLGIALDKWASALDRPLNGAIERNLGNLIMVYATKV